MTTNNKLHFIHKPKALQWQENPKTLNELYMMRNKVRRNCTKTRIWHRTTWCIITEGDNNKQDAEMTNSK